MVETTATHFCASGGSVLPRTGSSGSQQVCDIFLLSKHQQLRIYRYPWVGLKPIASVVQGGGSCGYEFANSSTQVSGGFQGSISSRDSRVANLPLSGCGSCVQVTCNLVGLNQVRPSVPGRRYEAQPLRIPSMLSTEFDCTYLGAGVMPARCKACHPHNYQLMHDLPAERPCRSLRPDCRQLAGDNQRQCDSGETSLHCTRC